MKGVEATPEEQERLATGNNNGSLDCKHTPHAGPVRERSVFASTRVFMLVFLSGWVLQGMFLTYFVSVTTTVEKLFKVESKTTGTLLAATEIGQICTALFLTYLAGRGHRPRWIACMMLVLAVGVIGCVLPHLMYGTQLLDVHLDSHRAGAAPVCYTYQNSTDQCDEAHRENSNTRSNITAVVIPWLFICLLVVGVGQTGIATLGIPYVDDNVGSKQSPLYMALLKVCESLKLLSMSPPAELSFEEILKFMLLHNGRVTNHELVKHFKVFLMNPDMRDEARSTFKKHVNTLANIKNQNNEKWLILKKKYMPNNGKANEEVIEKEADSSNTTVMSEAPVETQSIEEEPPQRPPLPLQLNQDFSIIANLIQDNTLNVGNSTLKLESDSKESLTSIPSEDIPPKVHPRRRSSDKNIEKRSSIQGAQGQRSSIPNQEGPSFDNSMSPTLTSSRSESMLVDSEQTISVKERKQMFNRMASESDVLKTNKLGGNLSSQGVDEEDRISLDQKSETDPLDSKQKQWILCAARGDYHALAKMCKENAKLVKTKDPFTGYTAMHWACKRGDENLVKLLGGVTRQIVNERSNGGYTPLHIAMQFRHENVYRLLVEVYDADPNVRDWSGRKPRQYLVHMDTSLSPGSYRKKEGFLRIGSLNVRVKKTTEAFSNFLGVGVTRSSAYVPKSARDREDRRSGDSDQLKSWGSADNIQKDDKLMPPPNNNKVRRRGASGRRGIGAAHSRSTPSTPDQPRAQMGVSEEGDSDSDSAAGFHAAWRQQRASNCT